MERAKNDPTHTAEKYNLYGFMYTFQVWAIEAIPLYSKMSHARRVSRTTPRILNWEAKDTHEFETLTTSIFRKRSIYTFQTLKPTDEEQNLPYVTGLDEANVSNALQFEPYDQCATSNENDEIDDDEDDGPDGAVQKDCMK
ncbi:hypothetical protein ACOSQ2_023432 [Xanthoceras sorbifolium]